MTLRRAPKGTTWFLKQFGSQSEDESVIGDLTERYQRGDGSIWYWRQVLSIVVVSHFRGIQRNKWNFFSGLFRAWCVWAGLFLVQLLVTSQVVRRGVNFEQIIRYIYLTNVILMLAKPLAVGAYIRRASRTHSRTILLAFIASYVVLDTAWMVTSLLIIGLNLPPGIASLIMLRNVMGLLLAVTLILLAGNGGTRGLSPLSLKR